jgi:hypothetical protein
MIIETGRRPEYQKKAPLNPHTERVRSNWHQLEADHKNQHVSIDYNQLLRTAREHFQDPLELPNWQFDGVYPQDFLTFASSTLTYNTINAAFNHPSGEKYSIPFGQGKPLSGSFAMVRKFYEHFGESTITTEQLLATFGSIDAVIHFFRGINDIPYPDLRYSQIQDFIRGLREGGQDPIDLLTTAGEYNQEGQITRLRAFDGEAGPGLVDTLIRQFPLAYGADVQQIGSLTFPFFKRAQLVALVLHGRAVHSGLHGFSDIHLIGPIADYEVPRSLRGLGILQVSSDLSERIQTWDEIKKDSPEEIELRAATVTACQHLLSTINELRSTSLLPPINMSHLDYWLWSQAKIVAKEIRPHLTQTMAY